MSLLLRAAVLGGIAYLITRSMSSNSTGRRSMRSARDRASPVRELHPGDHVWPTDESQPAPASAGPTS